MGMAMKVLAGLLLLMGLVQQLWAHDGIVLAADGESSVQAPTTEWLSHSLFESNIWIINDNNQDNIYVVEGENAALIIDTGLGYQNLKEYVRKLTKKPLVVVNSHAHPDHAGGNDVFEHVHIHKDELEALRYFTSEEIMLSTYENFVKTPMPDHLLSENKTPAEMLTIEEGFEFDLGGRTLEVLHIPGHSGGSIALHDDKSRNMFTGDMTTPHVWLQVPHATSVEDFLASIQKLQARKDAIHWLLPGHGGPLKPSHLDVLEAAAKAILSGECEVTPYKSPLGTTASCHYEGVVIVYNDED
jgi:hydroxyacylglutathione hydrolase